MTTCPTKYTTDCSGMAKGEIYEGAKEPRKPCAKQAARSEGEAVYKNMERHPMSDGGRGQQRMASDCLFCITGKERSVAEQS